MKLSGPPGIRFAPGIYRRFPPRGHELGCQRCPTTTKSSRSAAFAPRSPARAGAAAPRRSSPSRRPLGWFPLLPVQELYYAIEEVGLADAGELVVLASPEQLQGFIDLDVWERDHFDEATMRGWLDALVEVGPTKLAQAIEAIDPEADRALPPAPAAGSTTSRSMSRARRAGRPLLPHPRSLLSRSTSCPRAKPAKRSSG